MRRFAERSSVISFSLQSQLRRAFGRHEDVRWLDVAVDDEPLVRVGKADAYLKEGLEALLDAETTVVAVPIDRQALERAHR